jgi:hypothetical protein
MNSGTVLEILGNFGVHAPPQEKPMDEGLWIGFFPSSLPYWRWHRDLQM